MWRKIVSILSGVLIGFLLIGIGNVVVFNVFPFPEELDWFNAIDRDRYIASLPIRGLKSYIFIDMFGCMLSGIISAIIAKEQKFQVGLIASSVCLIYAICSIINTHYPNWFYYFEIIVCGLGGPVGAMIGSKK